MNWEYNVKFTDEEKPRHFIAEKQLTVREIQDRCDNSNLEWFNAKRVSDDDKTSD